ncbi:hypothetical protein K5I29_04090 [Flavobacterium agricola]|uniref:DUF7833 domain-containing protein n=1 Tax=Flavobacterium agricola TaxID=2870839 RepID=A0ABY6M0K4_9FLAO|nr:hypothetical protein [Flavobacterium agricola]UYW02089.1 hypothetical protein K5I29_04090 [Flavobacterium agricola]
MDTKTDLHWKEQVCMIYQIKLPEVDSLLDQFVLFLAVQQKVHSSKKEFVSHFNNWSRKEIQNKVKNATRPTTTFSMNR